jgi:lantibiotic modifying enzyme
LLDEEFSNKETRIREIIRATVFYTIIKCRSRQPSEIINNNYWDYVFKYLSEEDNYILPIKNRFISFIASSEIRDLQKGYVPIFYRDTYSRRLYNSSGECIEDFYNTDVKTYFREFILNLDNSFIENNVEAIRRCLYSTAQFDYEADIRGWIA